MTGETLFFHIISQKKKNHHSGGMIDHSIYYRAEEQRCLLGPAEPAHLDQKTASVLIAAA